MKKSLLFALFLLSNVSSSMAYCIERKATEKDKIYLREPNSCYSTTNFSFYLNQTNSFRSSITDKYIESRPGKIEKIGLSAPIIGASIVGYGMMCIDFGAWILGQSHKVQRIGSVGSKLHIATIALISLGIGLMDHRKREMKRKARREKERAEEQAQVI